MTTSELIVDINTANKELFKETEKGEKFYTIPIYIRGGEILALISGYLLKEINGRAKLKGYLESTSIREPREHMFTYFYINEMSQVSEDTPLTNKVSVSGKITKINKLITRTNGKHVLPIVISRVAGEKQTSVLHAAFTDADARKMNTLRDKRYNITAEGYITTRNTAIEVSIETYSLTERR